MARGWARSLPLVFNRTGVSYMTEAFMAVTNALVTCRDGRFFPAGRDRIMPGE